MFGDAAELGVAAAVVRKRQAVVAEAVGMEMQWH